MKAHQGRLKKTNVPSIEDFVKKTMPLVHIIADILYSRLYPSIEKEDMIQEGMIGLMKAYYAFDPNMGASLTTYAKIRVRGAMLDLVRKEYLLKRSDYKQSKKIIEAIREIEQREGREAHLKEISTHLNLPLTILHQLQQKCFGVNEPPMENGNLNPEEQLIQIDFYKTVNECFLKLSLREQNILYLYFEKKMSLKNIGLLLGVCESRVSQLLKKIFQCIKNCVYKKIK